MQPSDSRHCACVIHGDAYGWHYVDRLYNMLSRNSTQAITLHVYTEANRSVPDHMVKHVLTDWNIRAPTKSWWYKLQLFDPTHHSGPLLYLDLDTVIVNNIDWIFQQDVRQFWAIRDFQYLYRTTCTDINSSVMFWDTTRHSYAWQEFVRRGPQHVMGQYRGDQDYLTDVIHHNLRGWLPRMHSWRWQCWDGGYDFRRKTWHHPGAGTNIDHTDILVFHGRPKPHDVQDPVIQAHWR